MFGIIICAFSDLFIVLEHGLKNHVVEQLLCTLYPRITFRLLTQSPCQCHVCYL